MSLARTSSGEATAGDIVDIEVVETFAAEGHTSYALRHDYDLEIFTDLPSNGPFSSREEAETAAAQLREALACVDD